MPQPIQAVFGTPVALTGLFAVKAQTYYPLSGKVAMTPAMRVGPGLVTFTVAVTTVNGTNTLAIYRNGVSVATTLITTMNATFVVRYPARPGDLIQCFNTGAGGGTYILATSGSMRYTARDAWTPTARRFPIPAGTYNADSSGKVAMTPAIRVGPGLVTFTTVVTGGTGSNTQAIYRNGVSVATIGITGTGTWTLTLLCSSGDLIQCFDLNSAGNGETISSGFFAYAGCRPVPPN